MPFLLSDGVLLFCRSNSSRENGSKIWKLHYRDESGIHRIPTGLSDDVIECSPTAWTDSTGVHVSFVAGGGDIDPLYWLYQMDGATMGELGSPVQIIPARCGFVREDRIVHGSLKDFVYITEADGSKQIEIPNAYIYRVAYITDDPDVLLISGQFESESGVFSLRYDLRTGEQALVECDGVPAYKCCILGNTIIYAEKFGDNFEDRRLREAKIRTLQASKLAKATNLKSKFDPLKAIGYSDQTGCQGCAEATEQLRKKLSRKDVDISNE